MDWQGSSSAEQVPRAAADLKSHVSPVCLGGKKANGILRGVNSSTTHRLKEMMLSCCSTLIRPCLDVSFVSPKLKKTLIKQVQQKTIEMLGGWSQAFPNRAGQEDMRQ